MSDHKARKRFGQNFLTDEGIINQIVSAIAPRKDDHLVEIGPGLAALTQRLTRAGKLTLIELDRDLASRLRIEFVNTEHVELIEGDALTVDLDQLSQPLRLVGNLPYNVGTQLVIRFMQWGGAKDMTFMLQKEVVQRLCAEPGDKHYGRLAILRACYAQADYLFDVPPTAFDPPPKVDSAIIRLTPLRTPAVQINDLSQLEKVTAAAFGQRRKTLRNSLSSLISESDLEALGINPKLRAENLSPQEFANIANALEHSDGSALFD